MRSKILQVIMTLLLAASYANATTPAPKKYFDVKFVPIGTPVIGAPFTVQVRITDVSRRDRPFCKPYELAYKTLGKIALVDAPVSQHSTDSGQSFQVQLTVQCAPNDTANVDIVFRCLSQEGAWGDGWWFVSDDTSVTVQREYPSPKPKPKPDPRILQQEKFQKELQADTAHYRQIDEARRPIAPVPINPIPGKLQLLPAGPPSLDCLIPRPPLPGVVIMGRPAFQAKELAAQPADSLELWWVEGTHYLRRPVERSGDYQKNTNTAWSFMCHRGSR